mmetsp:Transcript_27153/g.105728  ORF Transcript_27153/g.105728 Transcript_27153/m.105728 type:complete len:279 (+) Transcript_27153:1733-2569(+)
MSSFALSVLRRADDSDHGVLKRLLALDGIEEIAKSFGRLVTREDILLQVLLPVLEQLTQPTSGEVSAKARSVLESISNIVGYESIAELYRRHLNFIVDSSARFLSPRKTADVLREVVEIVGDDALFILSDQIIRESDILPTLSDEMAVVSLERISSILAVARTAPVTAFGPLVPRLRKDVNKSVLEKLDIYSIQVPHKEQEVEEVNAVWETPMLVMHEAIISYTDHSGRSRYRKYNAKLLRRDTTKRKNRYCTKWRRGRSWVPLTCFLGVQWLSELEH